MASLLWKLLLLFIVLAALKTILFMRDSLSYSRRNSPNDSNRDGVNAVKVDYKIVLNNDGMNAVKVNPDYLVSYVMYAPPSSTDKVHKMCNVNANFFASHGMVHSPHIDYVFSLIGDTPPTNLIDTANRTMSNVRIMLGVPNRAVDQLAHLHTIQLLKKPYKYYILLNCDARGPYFQHTTAQPLTPSAAWLTYFTGPLRNGASAVGSTICLEISPHIQNYAMGLNYKATQFALSYWNSSIDPVVIGNEAKKLGLTVNLDVGLSTALLRSGFKIASLDSRMQYIYSSGYIEFPDEVRSNPTLCIKNHTLSGGNSSGCVGVDPCEVTFVKYGGKDYFDDNAPRVPSLTLQRCDLEESNIKSSTLKSCVTMPSAQRPNWDVASIFKNTSAARRDGDWIGVDTVSDMVIIVRVHSSYSLKLITLLWMLQSSAADQFKQVRVLVIPTDEPSVSVLRDALDRHWNKEKDALSPPNPIRVSLMEFPSWMYQKYGVYLAGLCTSEWRARTNQEGNHLPYEIARYCDINSPLHYLLVDLTLHFATTSLVSAKWVITTNADNFYSPGFFEVLASTNASEHDVVMSNMLTRGNILETFPVVGRVDLGAYAVSMHFVKRWNASFLGSLGATAGPRNYHNADGHFMEFLVSKQARVKKTAGYFFIHN